MRCLPEQYLHSVVVVWVVRRGSRASSRVTWLPDYSRDATRCHTVSATAMRCIHYVCAFSEIEYRPERPSGGLLPFLPDCPYRNILETRNFWVSTARGSLCTACTRRLKTHMLLFGEGIRLVWHIYALELRLQTEKLLNMASLYRTWSHLVPGWVACTRCRNPLYAYSIGVCLEIA